MPDVQVVALKKDGELEVRLQDEGRLAALRRTGLLDSPAEEAFDRLTRLVCRVLKVPVSLVSLVDDDRQFFKSAQGLAEPWASRRETPLSHSFCQHVVTSEEPLKVEDAAENALVCDNLAVQDLDVTAYLGVPILTPDGQAVGSLCAIDTVARSWTDDDTAVLSDLADIVMAEVAAREELHRHSRTGATLARVEQNFQAVLDATPDGFMVFDTVREGGDIVDFRWVYTNPAAEKIVGRSHEALAGKRLLEEMPGNREEGLFDAYVRVVETGEVWQNEFAYTHEGLDGWFRTTAAAAGEGLALAFTDITQQKRDEAKLRRQSEMMRLAHDAIIVWHPNGEIESWSRGAADLYGYSEAEALGRVTHELLDTQHPEPLEQVEAVLRRNGDWRGELHHCTKKGQRVIVTSRHQLIRGTDGEERVLEINRDITEQRQAARALLALNTTLEEQAERLRLALAAGRMGTFDWNLATDEVRFNDTQYELTGIDREGDLKASAFLERIHPDDLAGVEQAVAEAVASNGDYDYEFRFCRPDGVERWLAGQGGVLRDASGKAVRMLGVNYDITEQKEAEAALQHANEQLEERVHARTAELERSNAELDQFAYVASHDLKAPLRAVSSLATWLEEDAGDVLPDASKKHLEKLHGRIERMNQLLDDLLTYSRADRKGGAAEEVDLETLVAEIMGLFVVPKGFSVRVSGEVTTVYTSKVALETVLRNLIGNAIKHHDREDGVVEVGARVQEVEGGAGRKLEFQVSDDGPGIDGRFHERVFGIFQTLKPRDVVEGSGVGLAIVKKIVERRGGTVDLRSAPGEGAAFGFTWFEEKA